MKKSPNVVWVSPTSRPFFRSKGEVRCRPGTVIPKLAEQGVNINVLLPYDPTLLPKTKLSPARITRHVIRLAQDYDVDIIKLTRGSVTPGLYMARLPSLDSAMSSALFTKAALALAKQLKRPVDIFHVMDWEVSLLPLYLGLEKNGNRLFKNTRTMLSINTLREHGGFSPSVLDAIGVPKNLFHPEGIEFYGRLSFLKAGILLADSVSLSGSGPRGLSRNGHGFEGVLDAQSFKLHKWASDRSLRSHLDAYRDLMSLETPHNRLVQIMEKTHVSPKQVDTFIESWGPLPPDRYWSNGISFLVQSPVKAYAFWEWAGKNFADYGLILEDKKKKQRRHLARGLMGVGEYWLDVSPGQEYLVELIGYNKDGSSQPLLRSRWVRTPRVSPSPNTTAVFIDVKTRRRFVKKGLSWFEQGRFSFGGTSALEWADSVLPSSYREEVTSR